MTIGPTDTDLSYRLTESILSRTPNSTLSSSHSSKGRAPYHSSQQNQATTTPRLVATLPPNSIVIQPTDSKSSFTNYIGNHFKEDAPILLDRISVPSPVPTHPSLRKSGSTLWAYLSNDLDDKPTAVSSDISMNQYAKDVEGQNTWYDYDSILAGQPSTHLFSAGAFLFLFGFLCPPLWWIGSFYPTRAEDAYQNLHSSDIKMLKRWRTLNRFFSLGFSTLLIIALIIFAVLYSKT